MVMANQTENMRGGGGVVGMGTVFTVPREILSYSTTTERDCTHSTKDLCSEGLCSQYPQRGGLCSQYPQRMGLCSQYPQRGAALTHTDWCR